MTQFPPLILASDRFNAFLASGKLFGPGGFDADDVIGVVGVDGGEVLALAALVDQVVGDIGYGHSILSSWMYFD